MNGGERARTVVEILSVVRVVLDQIGTGNLTRLVDSQPGLSANHGDGSGGAISDPTGNAVERPDQPAHDLRNLDGHLIAALRALDKSRVVLSNYGPPRPAGEADRLALARENTRPEPMCAECATISEPHSDLPFSKPPDPRRVGPTDVGGRLPAPLVLCAWHVNFVEANGRLPTSRELAVYRDTGRVRVHDPAQRRRSA
jgi:hypothetical protein